jgi:hypothetical protein
MQVVLVMFRSDGERRSFSVVRSMTVIGRREDCDLRIPVGDVSRKHCRILSGDDGVRVEDLGSSNGTFVNHERVQQADLNPGDTLGVGPVQFVVQIDGVPDEESMTAPTAAAELADESLASGYGATVDEEPLEDELGVEEEPIEELPDEALAEEEFPLEELPAEELAEESEPLEALAGEEMPGEDLMEDETLESLEPPAAIPPKPARASGALDELEELPTAEEDLALEPLEELHETVIPEEELEEAPLAGEPAEEESLEELEVASEAAVPAPVAEDDLEVLPLPPRAHDAEAIEELELDEEPAAGVPAAEGSAWDFVIEESETERSPHELHIDLDAPHSHQQPHQ